MILKLILTIAAIFSWGSSVMAQEIDASKLDPAIAQVWSGGYWNEGGTDGFIRIIVGGYGFDHRKNTLHVQWIETPRQQEDGQSIVTVSIAELNDNPIYVFNTPQCLDRPGCSSFELSANNTYDMSKRIFRLTLGPVGQYTLE